MSHHDDDPKALPAEPAPETLADRLRAGAPVADEEFDAIYPTWARRLSTIHWTPVDVARRAAQLLVRSPTDRVLDIGSGTGKFCVVAALTRTATYYGVEQRPHFVAVARTTATLLRARRVTIVHGNAMTLDWRGFDAFYAYNPFAENLSSVVAAMDDSVVLHPRLFQVYVEFVRLQLEHARPGARVVTYHGFGADLPASYHLEHREEAHTDYLELWVKDGTRSS